MARHSEVSVVKVIIPGLLCSSRSSVLPMMHTGNCENCEVRAPERIAKQHVISSVAGYAIDFLDEMKCNVPLIVSKP